MRSYAESRLSSFPNYHSLHTTAEATGLEDDSVDIITAAQAFHWFDREACKEEFRRILAPGGRVFLIWNDRQHSTDFLRAYEALLQEAGTDYTKINHQNISEEELKSFFSSGFERVSFHNQQDFDLEGFLGRVFSSSYTPSEDDPRYGPFKRALLELFDRYQQDDMVSFIYKCEVYSGNME